MFDTNIVVSALVFGARLSWLRALWRGGLVVPLVCRETVVELLRVLAYPKFRLSPADQQAVLGDYLPFAETILLPAALPPLPAACRDRDDIVFIALAVASGADFLVSGDRDIAMLRPVIAIPVLTASEFETRMSI